MELAWVLSLMSACSCLPIPSLLRWEEGPPERWAGLCLLPPNHLSSAGTLPGLGRKMARWNPAFRDSANLLWPGVHRVRAGETPASG